MYYLPNELIDIIITYLFADCNHCLKLTYYQDLQQKLIINNIAGEELGYSQYKYDFKIATQEDIIFPSMDPCIFELKYPNNDIRGKITQY